tara:strand:- start:604 stop:1140 length:537 start_codon:yes stop_codon:yes gene_type:complete
MKFLHFILIFLLPLEIFSQDDNSREILSDSLNEQGNKKAIESMMIWKLTEELELEVDQAEKFFPRFRQHRAEMDNLRRKQRSLAGSLKLNMKNEKLTSSEVSRIIKETSSLKRRMSDLEEKFLINSGDILNPLQQAKLGVFKHKMMKDLKGKMKNKRSEKSKRKFRNERKRNKRQFWN